MHRILQHVYHYSYVLADNVSQISLNVCQVCFHLLPKEMNLAFGTIIIS